MIILIDPDEYYKRYYEEVFNQGLISQLSTVMHNFIEFPHRKKSFNSILEVGSGHGQHFQHVKCKFQEYIELDLRDLEVRDFSDANRKQVQGNAEDLQGFETNSVDRLIATCLLVHLPNPEKALMEWRRVVRGNGILDIYVPCEPGIFLRIFRSFTTVPKSKKLGINHKSMHYREHRNSYILCSILIKEIFVKDKIKISKFPWPIPGWNSRLFDVYRIKIQK